MKPRGHRFDLIVCLAVLLSVVFRAWAQEPLPLPVPKSLPNPLPLTHEKAPQRPLNAITDIPKTSAKTAFKAAPLSTDRPYQSPDAEIPEQFTPTTDLNDTSVKLYIDDRRPVTIAVQASADFSRIFFDTGILLDQLKSILRDGIFREVYAQMAGRRWIGVRELKALGFSLDVYPQSYNVTLQTPAKIRKWQIARVTERLVYDEAYEIRPATTSASLSTYLDLYRNNNEIVAATAFLEGNLTHNNWILENDYVYDALDRLHRRRSTSISKIDETRYIKYSAGDINYRTLGLMGQSSLLGITAGTNFSLQPYFISTPLTHQKFFLDQNSKVKIIVNNSVQKQMQLQAGYYDLVDFSLVPGINNVTIEVTGSDGQTKYYDYQGYFDARLLAVGVLDFGFAAGIRRFTANTGEIEYDPSKPAASAFLRGGLTPYVTLGATGESTPEYASGGGLVALLTPIGTFETSAASGTPLTGAPRDDYALGIDYLFARSNYLASMAWRYNSENYRRLGQASTSLQIKQTLMSSLSVPAYAGFRPNLRASFTERWVGTQERSVNFRIEKPIPSLRANIAFEAYWQQSMPGSINRKGYVVSFNWGAPRFLSMGASYGSANQKSLNIGGSLMGETGVSFSGAAMENDKMRRYSGGARMSTTYMDYAFNGFDSTNLVSSEHQRYEHHAMETGFGYAGGTFAWGRALHRQPFAIVKNASDTGGEPIMTGRNNAQDRMQSLSWGFSRALMRNMAPYSISQVYARPRDPMANFRLDQTKFNVYSTYRSGAIIRLDGSPAVYGEGILQDARGVPMGLILARAVRIKDNYTVPFFTDETGAFTLEALRAGRYRIEINEVEERAEFDVVPGEEHIVQLGAVRLQ